MNAPLISSTDAITQILSFLYQKHAELLARGVKARVTFHRGTEELAASIKLIWTPDGPARVSRRGENREYALVIAVAHQLPISCYFDGAGLIVPETRRTTMGPLCNVLPLWFDTFIAETRALFQQHFGPSFMELSSDALANLVQHGEQHLRETVRQGREAAAAATGTGAPALA
jgi:hypothetical protein